VQFKRINAEDSANAALVQKYNIHAYPTLVYVDSSGKVLLNQAGAPMSADDFMRSINSAR
jgi:thioredoxin-related protein